MKPAAKEKFEAYFTEVYGPRWPRLRAALQTDFVKVTLENPFGSAYENYHLDRASLLPVHFLAAKPGERIADLCASPGGKLLALIFSLKGEGEFYANDLSPARVQRLKAILHDCLPPEFLTNVEVKKGDGSRWGMNNRGIFQRVLVDAPCSGERHLLQSEKELARWSRKGSQRLSVRQHALLCAGFDSLQVGGRVVYSTCSISPLENDGVVQKILKSRKEEVRLVPVSWGEEEISKWGSPLGEPSAYGWIVLPDQAQAGPIYFSILEKVARDVVPAD